MITNINYIKRNITNNGFEPVPYRWTHGATNEHMGDGIIVYSLIQHMRAKNCVCIGSGGGYIPRIMTQARVDLHKQGIFTGVPEYNWGDIYCEADDWNEKSIKLFKRLGFKII
jgi:hypothetical protein